MLQVWTPEWLSRLLWEIRTLKYMSKMTRARPQMSVLVQGVDEAWTAEEGTGSEPGEGGFEKGSPQGPTRPSPQRSVSSTAVRDNTFAAEAASPRA